MKRDKKIIFTRAFRYATVVACSLAVVSCSKYFEELNTNPTGITDDHLKADFNYIGMKFTQPQQAIYGGDPGRVGDWQVAHNLNADAWGGYMSSPGFKFNSNYSLNSGWNNSPWADWYPNNMAPTKNIIETAEKDGFPDLKAVAMLLRVAGMHQVAEKYGPICYTQYGKGGATASYDTEEVLWKALIGDVASATESLQSFVNDPENSGKLQRFKPFDVIFKGDYNQWIKFGNSLRLRLAMRVSNVAPELARANAEAAVAGGVFEQGIGAVITSQSFKNPLYEVTQWEDTNIAATFVCILQGYNDPRLQVLVLPATGKYKGQYAGVPVGNIGDKNRYKDLSKPRLQGYFTTENPSPILFTSEVFFLRAEGALRGWNMGGTPAEFYDKGVRESFNQHGVAGYVETYLNDDQNNAAAPLVDPTYTGTGDQVGEINPNIPAGDQRLKQVTIKWDEAASKEEKLSRIITQKWIAVFPLGQEAWSEYRRTGYPNLFPVANNESNNPFDPKLLGAKDVMEGTVAGKVQIRRLPFAKSEVDNNPAEVAKATTYLSSGQDMPSTRLWWDTGSNNL